MPSLPRRFYAGDTLEVARSLLGMRLVHAVGGRARVGRIVETEAYQGPKDLASHASKGRTARTEVMFGPPGHAYVYLIYGFWHCFNVVTAPEDVPHAVLIRAVEPVQGIDSQTWGPGLLCRAMDIDRELNGADLCSEILFIEKPAHRERIAVGTSRRIGVESSGKWARKAWRFFDKSSAYVSKLSRARRAALLGPGPKE